MEKKEIKSSVVEKEKEINFNKWLNNDLLNAIVGDESYYVLIWNENNDIEYVSPSFHELTDRDLNELIGKKWTRIIDIKYQSKIMNHTSNSQDKLTIPHIHFENFKNRQYMLRGTLHTININNEKYFLCKILNISHKHMLEESIFNSHRFLLINQLSAGLVHEIKNPLASIRGFLQLIQKGIQQKDEYFELMILEVDKIRSLTNELLEKAKPINHFVCAEENVQSMVSDVCYLLSVQAKLRHVKLDVDLPKDLYVTCNRTKIQQVLINIIKNSIESMKDTGAVYISSYYEDYFLVISVRDEGKGIKQSDIDNLNTPFYTTKTDGNGLGLMICNKIIKQHNGKIRVSSKPSYGTNFELLLPLS